MYSLLLAREYLEQDDTLLLESDVIFEPEILLECASHPAPNVAVVARFEPWMDGTVTVLDERQRVIRIVSKREMCRAEYASYYTTVNLYKLSRRFSRCRFVPFLAARTLLCSKAGHLGRHTVAWRQHIDGCRAGGAERRHPESRRWSFLSKIAVNAFVAGIRSRLLVRIVTGYDCRPALPQTRHSRGQLLHQVSSGQHNGGISLLMT